MSQVRNFVAMLMVVSMTAAWGCGGKEPGPPPGVEGTTKAPSIEMGTPKDPVAPVDEKK